MVASTCSPAAAAAKAGAARAEGLREMWMPKARSTRAGQVGVEQPQHHPGLGLEGLDVEGGLEVDDVAGGDHHHRAGPLDLEGLEGLGQADVGHQHGHAQAAHGRQVAVALLELGRDQRHPQVVELLDHPEADVAEPADDHVVMEPAGTAAPITRSRRALMRASVMRANRMARAAVPDSIRATPYSCRAGGALRRWMSPNPVVVMIVTVK
jgi:hypothetical protein